MATASTARRPTAPASCSPAASRRSKLTVSSGSIAYLPLRARLFLRLRSAEPASRLAAGTSVRLSRVQTVLCEGPPDRSRHLVGRKGLRLHGGAGSVHEPSRPAHHAGRFSSGDERRSVVDGVLAGDEPFEIFAHGFAVRRHGGDEGDRFKM